MKRDIERNSESGQIIVILVIAAVVVIAFVGLAVDGSLLFSERRVTQSVADMAAINAARAMCQGEDIQDAVDEVLVNNGFIVDENNLVEINNPPTDAKYEGNSEYIEIIVYTRSASSLMSVVDAEDMEVTSKAVARCSSQVITEPSEGPVGGGNALIALNPTTSKAVWASGQGLFTITPGGVFANSDSSTAVWVSGQGGLTTDVLNVVGNYTEQGQGRITAGEINTGVGAITDPLIGVSAPVYSTSSCTPISLSHTDSMVIDPGHYCYITLKNQSSLTMNPGTYYLYGNVNHKNNANLIANDVQIIMDSGDFNITGRGSFMADNFFIYLKSGSVDINGPSTLLLSAAESGPWQGLTIFMDRNNSSSVHLAGQTNSVFEGTYYAKASYIQFTGQSGTTIYNGQFIGDSFKIAGQGTLSVAYENGKVFHPPVTTTEMIVELVE